MDESVLMCEYNTKKTLENIPIRIFSPTTNFVDNKLFLYVHKEGICLFNNQNRY